MNSPLISVIHPTARVVPSTAFPTGWRDAAWKFFRAAAHPENIEYLLIVHESRWEDFWKLDAQTTGDRQFVRVANDVWAAAETGIAEGFDTMGARAQVPPFGSVVIVKNSGRDCVVDQVNAGLKECSGKVVMGIMDDLFPPEAWDAKILEALPVVHDASIPGFPRIAPDFDQEAIVLCSTGASPERERELMICCAQTKVRSDRIGYGLHPDFESMWADNFYSFEARRDEAAGLCKIIERLDIQFEHRHPIFGKGDWDSVYALQNREEAYAQGQAIFHQKVTGLKVMAICLPGESFRHEWCATTLQMVQQLGHMGYITEPLWAYSSMTYSTRIKLARGVLECRPKPDYVLWVDDDNLVTASQVGTLVQDLEEYPELGGVTGWCWCDHAAENDLHAMAWKMSVGRQTRPGLKCATFTPEDYARAYSVKPVITSDDVAPDAFWSGFPCVLMRRSTLEKLGWEAFVPIVRPDVQDGIMAEDASFFFRAHDAGIKFGVDIRVKVPHVKWRAIEPAVTLGEKPTPQPGESVPVSLGEKPVAREVLA